MLVVRKEGCLDQQHLVQDAVLIPESWGHGGTLSPERAEGQMGADEKMGPRWRKGALSLTLWLSSETEAAWV